MDIEFHNSFARDVPHGVLVQTPDAAPGPALVLLNEGLAQALHLPVEKLREHGAQWFSGASWPAGAVPRAMAYAGHQFGGFSPVLGVFRAGNAPTKGLYIPRRSTLVKFNGTVKVGRLV